MKKRKKEKKREFDSTGFIDFFALIFLGDEKFEAQAHN